MDALVFWDWNFGNKYPLRGRRKTELSG